MNLNKNEELALAINKAVLKVKKADWKGNLQKENEIKAKLYEILQDVEEVENIFPIIKQQDEY
jgi:type I restriction enzyme, R subunit